MLEKWKRNGDMQRAHSDEKGGAPLHNSQRHLGPSIHTFIFPIQPLGQAILEKMLKNEHLKMKKPRNVRISIWRRFHEPGSDMT